MKVYKSDTDFDIKECVATIGFFDGVHAGHRFLINELNTLAISQNRKSVVFTFAEHPRKVLHADFQPSLISTPDEKLAQLESTGVDACVLLHFSEAMSKLTASEFLRNILFDQYHVRTLLVGHDHRFGHNRAEGFDDYVKYGSVMGLEVKKATRFATEAYTHISSSEVRNALQTGNVQKAADILTYNYSFVGKVVDGYKVGRKIGFPTANLEPIDNEKLIPGTGVYAVKVKWNGATYKGMMNIGLRPTLDNGSKVSLEVNIFDFDEDIYNQQLQVLFVQKIRDEQKFNGVDALVEQLNRDKIKVLEILD